MGGTDVYVKMKPRMSLHVDISASREDISGEARGHACHAVHDQSFSEKAIIFINFHGQNVHKTKFYVL